MEKLVKDALKPYLEMRKKELVKGNFNMEVSLASKLFTDYLEKPIDEVFTPEAIEAIYLSIINGDMNQSYKARSVALLRKFIEFLELPKEREERLLYIARSVKLVKNSSARIKVLTQDEYERLLNIIKNPQDKIFVQFVYYFGVNSRDLVVLTWDDIDLENKVVTITPQGEKKTLTAINETTTFKIEEPLYKDLLAYKECSYASSWLFPSYFFKGKHIEERTIRERLRKYGYLIGIEEEISVYSLAQVRLNTLLENLLDKKVVDELKERYRLSELQIVRKYLGIITGGDRDAV